DAGQKGSRTADVYRHDLLVQRIAVDVGRVEGDGQGDLHSPIVAFDLELPHEHGKLAGDGGQLLRRFLRLLRARQGALGGVGHAFDIDRDLARAASGFVTVARHLAGRRTLFFNGGGDGRGDGIDLVNDVVDRPDGRNRALRVRLDGGDSRSDVFSRFGGLLGEFLDFIGDDGKPLARFAGAGGLNGGIQGKQVGLLRDGGNHLDDFADLGAGLAQLRDGRIGGLGGAHRRGGDFSGFMSVGGDVLDGRG